MLLFISPVTHASKGFGVKRESLGKASSKLFSIIFQKVLARWIGRCYSSPPADATHEAKLKNKATKVGEAKSSEAGCKAF
jgi:hypothetical protein